MRADHLPFSMHSMMAGVRRGLLTTALLAIMASAAVSEGDDFQQQLELAAKLNLTAPWQESQAILDRIEPELEEATPDQFATFQLLKIRNLALMGDYIEGLQLTRQLLEHDIPSEHRLGALVRGTNLGLELRRFEEAFDYLYQSLVLASEVNDPEQITYAYSLAAEIFRVVGKVDRAREYAQRSLDFAREHDDVRAQCIATMHLAAAYRAADHFARAGDHFRSALQLCRQASDPVFVGIAEFGLGDILRRKDRFDEAEAHLDRALRNHRSSGYRSGESETLLSLAKLYRRTGREQQAESTLTGLIDDFAETERWDFLATSHELLGRIASDRGDHVLAVEHALSQIDAMDRFLDLARARQLAYLEIEFETLYRDQELSLLRERQRVSRLQEQTRVQRRWLHGMAYASGGFLTVILVLLLMHARRERRHYQRLSGLDSLTGLSNHTRFFESAQRLVNEGHTNQTDLVLILGDLDHFKEVNDIHGHLIGDQALRQVAGVLMDVFANRGLIGRIGGEEFAVCLSRESLERVQQLLETLRRRLRAVDYGVEGRALTMSLGIAQLQPGENLGKLRQRADVALYEAKRAGRNTVVVAPENSPKGGKVRGS